MTDHIAPTLVSEIPGHSERINAQRTLHLQPKLDGWCCMANTVTRRIYTRAGHEITTLPHINLALPTAKLVDNSKLYPTKYPEPYQNPPPWDGVSDIRCHNKTLVSPPEWLHGELWKPGADCDSVGAMVRAGDASLEFHVFDVVANQNVDARMIMVSRLTVNEVIKTVPTMVGAPDEVDKFYEACMATGYEGIIIRLDDYGYYHGRSVNIFKMKPAAEVI